MESAICWEWSEKEMCTEESMNALLCRGITQKVALSLPCLSVTVFQTI